MQTISKEEELNDLKIEIADVNRDLATNPGIRLRCHLWMLEERRDELERDVWWERLERDRLERLERLESMPNGKFDYGAGRLLGAIAAEQLAAQEPERWDGMS